MSSIPFPVIAPERLIPIRAALALFRQNPSLLDEAPYAPDVKSFFQEIIKTDNMFRMSAEDIETEFDGVQSWDLVEKQIRLSLQQLINLQIEVDQKNVKERLEYHKMVAGLLERLTNIKEKNASVKEAAKFMSTVMEIIDSIMTPDQRTLIMERLEQFVPTSGGTNA